MARWFAPKVQAPASPQSAEPPPSRTDPIIVEGEQRERARRKMGRVATLLAGGYNGDTSAPTVGVKQLLGS